MPLFYFDVRDGHKLMRDDDGLEFPNIEAARDEATRALGELAKDVLPGRAVREMAIEVRDEVKDPLLRAVLRFEIERLRYPLQWAASHSSGDATPRVPRLGSGAGADRAISGFGALGQRRSVNTQTWPVVSV